MTVARNVPAGVPHLAAAPSFEAPEARRPRRPAQFPLHTFLPVVGRDEELASVDAVIDRVLEGRSSVLLLDGEAGIGKTRLLEEAASRAHWLGIGLLGGSAGAGDEERPFGLLADALDLSVASFDPRRARVAHRIAAVRDPRLDHAAVDASAIDGIVDLVRGLTGSGPLLLVLDDLQHADPASLRAIDGLGRRLRHLPFGLVAAFRPWTKGSPLERMVGSLVSRGCRRHLVAPLPDRAMDRIAELAMGGPAGPRLRSRLSAAGGSPEFAIEHLRTLFEAGALRRPGAGGLVDCDPTAPPLRATLLRRTRGLSLNALHAVRLAAELGECAEIERLAALAGVTVARLRPAIDEAVSAGILARRGDRGLAFRQAELRMVMLELPAREG